MDAVLGHVVRSSSLTRFAEVAAGAGLDAAALAAEAGLPPTCLGDPDLWLAYRDAAGLIETAAERARDPAFGIRMADSRRLSNLGVLGLLCRDVPTLRDVIDTLVRHAQLQNEALDLWLETSDDTATLHFQLEPDRTGRPFRQAVELAVGTTFQMLTQLAGPSWHAQACFAHSAAPNLAPYRHVLGRAPTFGCEFNGIVLAAPDLDLPNRLADPAMARYYAQAIAEPARSQERRQADRVRATARALLPHGHCLIETVARTLGVSRRTLADHLAAEGTTFSDIVDDLRFELLDAYLRDGTKPLNEVATLLGFDVPSSFSRWHRARFGQSARRRALELAAERRGPQTPR